VGIVSLPNNHPLGDPKVSWLVACTRPGHEYRAHSYLRQQRINSYLPASWDKKLRRPRLVFPSYILVELRDPMKYGVLNTCWGVRRTLMAAGRPAILPLKFIRSLKKLENPHGHIVFEQPAMAAPTRVFANGDRVRLRDCAFEGALGLYQGATAQQREMVLLDQLGLVQVSTRQLEHAA
jgi:transcription antitermination factor NusG